MECQDVHMLRATCKAYSPRPERHGNSRRVPRKPKTSSTCVHLSVLSVREKLADCVHGGLGVLPHATTWCARRFIEGEGAESFMSAANLVFVIVVAHTQNTNQDLTEYALQHTLHKVDTHTTRTTHISTQTHRIHNETQPKTPHHTTHAHTFRNACTKHTRTPHRCCFQKCVLPSLLKERSFRQPWMEDAGLSLPMSLTLRRLC